MKKSIRKIIALLLSCMLVFSSVTLSASAADWLDIIGGLFGGNTSAGNIDFIRLFFQAINKITTEEDGKPAYIDRSRGSKEITAQKLAEYQEYVKDFNKNVNLIKKKCPAFDRIEMAGLPVEASVGAQIGDKTDLIGSLISIGTGLLFGSDNVINISNAITAMGIDTLFSEKRESEIELGQVCDNLISVKGTNFVSNLTADDFCDIDYTASRYGGYVMKGYLWDQINPDAASAQGRVFDLLDDVKFFSMLKSYTGNMDLSFLQFKYVDCYVELKVNKMGDVQSYTTHYKCVLHVDESADTANIGQYLGFSDTVLYESEIIYKNFKWKNWLIGDVNGDLDISVIDARYCLRAALGLEIVPEGSAKYRFCDANQDGKLTVVDARKILRTALGLDTIVQPLDNV
jgi:hypothetical protein